MKLYNTLTRKKEEFLSINKKEVRMYSCGPTVYNYFHIGNARPFIIFDTLRNYLKYLGYNVIFVQNFTDIDDKIINKAKQESRSINEITEFYIEEYFKDAKELGISEATYHPKATENIDEIIRIIEKLENLGYAYIVDGDVYFNTKRFTDYGKLSKQSFEELEAGARVEVNEKKINVMDFILWKAKKPGEPSWKSPWGDGRPGWHIECSAMANKYLGETIDIHSGGQDLIFPHHENEIAQSEAANSKPFANYWLHNGFININNEKMSKSSGNFFTVRDILKMFNGEVLRFFMLSAHYRNPINFSLDLLEQSKNALERIYNCLDNLNYLKENSIDREYTEEEENLERKLLTIKEKFFAAMDDDLNTADAISYIFDAVKEINSFIAMYPKSTLKIIQVSYSSIKEMGAILGLLSKENKKIEIDVDIEKLINERQNARAQKDFKKADEIRDMLKNYGIILEDTSQGVKWKKV